MRLALLKPSRYYERLFLSPLYFGGLGRSNFYGMLLDTVWATISMAVVVSMRGMLNPAVAIAVYNQLEELNQLIGNFFSVVDAAAQTLPVRNPSPGFFLPCGCTAIQQPF